MSFNVKQIQHDLANGHNETWLLLAITFWGIAVILFSWWLVLYHKQSFNIRLLLAAILLYEVLP